MYEQIDNYYSGNKAYLLFLRGELFEKDEHKNFILEDRYYYGAVLGNVSSLLLATKEDIVENEGNLVYSSKVFDDLLANSVDMIASKTSDGYEIDGYTFADKETLIATIRNKIAHGDFEINFEKHLVILNVKDNKVSLDIDKLATFVMSAFTTTLKNYKGSSYKRSLLSFDRKEFGRDKPINDISTFRYIAKNFTNTVFEIKSNDNSEISKECRELLEYFLGIYREAPQKALNSKIFDEMVKYLKSKNCRLIVKSKKIKDKELINSLEEYAKAYLMNKNLNYETQITLMGMEMSKYFGDTHRFDNAFAYCKNLILLKAIKKLKSVDHERISRKLFQDGYTNMVVSYNEMASAIINMFVSLFVYPFENLYIPTKEYQEEKKDLDFSLIDTSLFRIDILEINDNPLKEMKIRCDSCIKETERIENSLEKCKENLENVRKKGNAKANLIIETQIKTFEQQLKLIRESAVETKEAYDKMQKDYLNNSNYFKNEAIIRGIRDSISHGNYEVTTNPAMIVFKDIYEGTVHFQAEISLADFYLFIENNEQIVFNFIKNKDKNFKKNEE